MSVSIKVNSLETTDLCIGQGNNAKTSCDVFNTYAKQYQFVLFKINSCLIDHFFLLKGIAVCNADILYVLLTYN